MNWKNIIVRFRYTLRNLLLITLFLSACQAAPVSSKPTTLATVVAGHEFKPTPTTPALVSLPNPIWTYQTEGAIWGTAAVNNQSVYIGSDDANLYAIDITTGELKWKFPTRGLVRSHPAFSDNLVFFSSDDGNVYAIDSQSAQLVWKVDIGNYSTPAARENPGVIPDPTIFDYLQSSPLVYEGRVYIGSADAKIYALEVKTGDIIWTFQTGQKIRATPAIGGNTIYVGSWDGTVYAFQTSNGQLLWQTPIGGQIQSTALVANNFIYTASRKASVVALDAQTGKIRWEYDYGKNMWVESSPQLAGNILYIGSSGNKNVVGLNSQSGELYTKYLSTSFFWSTPIIIDNLLYIGAEAFTPEGEIGGLCSFKIPTKIDYENRSLMKLQWIFPVTKTLMPDGNWAGVVSSPIIHDGVFYFGGLDGKFYALATGQ